MKWRFPDWLDITILVLVFLIVLGLLERYGPPEWLAPLWP